VRRGRWLVILAFGADDGFGSGKSAVAILANFCNLEWVAVFQVALKKILQRFDGLLAEA
jgi:hypothetical protein